MHEHVHLGRDGLGTNYAYNAARTCDLEFIIFLLWLGKVLVGEPSHHKCLGFIESLELKDVLGRMLLA